MSTRQLISLTVAAACAAGALALVPRQEEPSAPAPDEFIRLDVRTWPESVRPPVGELVIGVWPNGSEVVFWDGARWRHRWAAVYAPDQGPSWWASMITTADLEQATVGLGDQRRWNLELATTRLRTAPLLYGNGVDAGVRPPDQARNDLRLVLAELERLTRPTE